MKKRYIFICVVLFAVSASVAVVQMDFSKVEIQTTKVAGNVYMLHGQDDVKAFSGGNIAVSVGDDGVLMVDSKFAPLSDKIKKAIKSLGGDSPKYILNTHIHPDHINGNPAYRNDGTVIGHVNIRKRLMDDEKPADTWPTITFDQTLSIHMNGEEIKAVHYPKGHTDGDGVIYFMGSNVVHMGDHFFNGMLPYIDLDSGGTVQGYVINVKAMYDSFPDDTKIVPGHGPLATKDDLKTSIRMLEETITLVTDKMHAGKSLAEIQAEGLQEEWDSWSWSFIPTKRWIEIIYNSHSEAGGSQ